MIRVMVGALSGWQFPKRRQRCLETWISDIHTGRYVVPPPQPTTQVIDGVLIMGTLQIIYPERYGDLLFLPAPNAYQFLVQRVREFFKWSLNFSWWDYVMKTDDDTRLDLSRLLAYNPKGADYLGPEWKPGVGYGSGNGYLLSRRAATIVAEKMTDWEGSEDLRVGKTLREAGIPLCVDNEHFRVFAGPNDAPNASNNWIYASPRAREPE